MVELADHKTVQARHEQRLTTLIIILINLYFKFVPIFSPEYFKIMLIPLIGDAITFFSAVEHLCAIHVVEHHVFQIRLECFRIYRVEIYEVEARD